MWEVFPPGHAAKLQKKWGKRLLWWWLLRDNRYFNVGGGWELCVFDRKIVEFCAKVLEFSDFLVEF